MTPYSLRLHKPLANVLFIIALIVTLMIGGCAHQRPGTRDAAHTAQNVDKTVTDIESFQPATKKTVTENGRVFRLVSTPFGVIKQEAPGPLPAAPALHEDQFQTSPAPAVSNAPAAPAPAEKAPAAPTARKAAASVVVDTAGAADASEVTLNFDDADLYEVVRFMAEILKINYMIDPAVKGRVSIHTAGRLRQEDLFPIFYQVLEANGLTAVREGRVYKITSLKEAQRLPMLSRTGRDYEAAPPQERVIMQIIPLAHIKADEMTKILTPFVSADGAIIAHANTNTLLLVDKGISILKALQLVETFDVDIFESVQHRFFKIQHNSAEEMAKLLGEVLKAYSADTENSASLIPIKHLNMLLVLSRQPRLFEKIASMITAFDTPNATVQPKLYVYAIKNGRADDLAGLLNEVFSSDSAPSKEDQPMAGATVNTAVGETAAAAPIAGNPFMKAAPAKASSKTAAPSGPMPAGGEGQGPGTLRGQIRITPDPIRNALIIEAIPSDYAVIQGILERLDVLPRQVLIEVVIAEIQLGDDFSFGVDWDYKDNDTIKGHPSTRVLQASLGATGLLYRVGQKNLWSAQLSALVKDNKATILSAPTLLASNDKEAKIDVSDEIPVASSTFKYGNSGNDANVETKIEYRNTGLILSVTPHINENGRVSLEINHELSEAANSLKVAGADYPSFKKRSVTTELTVGHLQTIVIGGLISEKKEDTDSGVPLLSKIPLLGALFGSTTRKNSRKELIIMITPRVIVSLDDVDQVTRDFKAKVSHLTY